MLVIPRASHAQQIVDKKIKTRIQHWRGDFQQLPAKAIRHVDIERGLHGIAIDDIHMQIFQVNIVATG